MTTPDDANNNDGAKTEGTGGCTRCACKGFIADPTEPNTCIAAGSYPNLCGHSKGAHR